MALVRRTVAHPDEAMPPVLMAAFQEEVSRRGTLGEIYQYSPQGLCVESWEWPFHDPATRLGGLRVAPSGLEAHCGRFGMALPLCFCAYIPRLAHSDCYVEVFRTNGNRREHILRCKRTTTKPFNCLYSVVLKENAEIYGIGNGPLVPSRGTRTAHPRNHPYRRASVPALGMNRANDHARILGPVFFTPQGNIRHVNPDVPAALHAYEPGAFVANDVISNFLAAYNSTAGVPTDAFHAFHAYDRFCDGCGNHFAGDEHYGNHLVRGRCPALPGPSGARRNSEDRQDEADIAEVEAQVNAAPDA